MRFDPIERYRVLAKIGEGGMGEVFLAEGPEGKKLALKQIKQEYRTNLKRRELFLKEAHTARTLAHAGVMPVLDIFEGETPFYTMPYFAEGTLKALYEKAIEKEKNGVMEKEFSIGRLLPLFEQICQAVSYAHRQGVLHRDLKPSNVLLAGNKIAVSDWGLFFEKGEDAIAGTVSYMEPKVLLGETPTVQTDLYALGLILYQMLTLRTPFHRENYAEFCQTWGREVLLPPEQVAPHRQIPLHFSDLSLKCLQGTYSTVENLINDLKKEPWPQPFSGAAPYQRLPGKAHPYVGKVIEVEKPCFIELKRLEGWPPEVVKLASAFHLAYHERDVQKISEIFETVNGLMPSPLPLLAQGICALISLEEWTLAEQKLDQVGRKFLDVQALALFGWLRSTLPQAGIQALDLAQLPPKPTYQHLLPVFLLLDRAIREKNTTFIKQKVDFIINERSLGLPLLAAVDAYAINALLLENRFDEVKGLLNFYLNECQGNLPLELTEYRDLLD